MEPRGIEPDNLTMSMVLRAAEMTGASEWAWLLMEVGGKLFVARFRTRPTTRKSHVQQRMIRLCRSRVSCLFVSGSLDSPSSTLPNPPVSLPVEPLHTINLCVRVVGPRCLRAFDFFLSKI